MSVLAPLLVSLPAIAFLSTCHGGDSPPTPSPSPSPSPLASLSHYGLREDVLSSMTGVDRTPDSHLNTHLVR
jgi:hypothetical protein